MTYNKFKRELYENISQRKEVMGMQIKLLERQSICEDMETARFVEFCNAILCGRREVDLKEDLFCVAWKEWEVLRLLCWRMAGLYRQFLQEGWQGVLPEILVKLQNYGRQTDTEKYGTCRSSFERQILRPMNYQRNKEELKNSVYWRLGDIALVLHDFLYESGEDCHSMRISRDAVRGDGLSDEVMLINALFQTSAILPPRLYHSGDIRRYFCGQAGVFMPGDFGERIVVNRYDCEEGMRGYRLTNPRRTGGAAALFYPGVQERLAEIFGGDYYVGFLGIHEAVIHPIRFKKVNEMKASIRNYNAVLGQEEVLTDSVYRYDHYRRRLFEA